MEKNKPNLPAGKPVSPEDWMEEIFNLLKKEFEKEHKPRKPVLEDLDITDTEGVCSILRVTAKTVADMRNKGQIRFTKFRSRYYYPLADIRRTLSEGFDRK